MNYQKQEDEKPQDQPNFELTCIVLPQVIKFINKLKQLSPSLRFKLVNRRVFKLFSDLGSDYSYYLNNNFFIHKPTFLQRIKYKIENSQNILFKFLNTLINFMKQIKPLQPGSTILLTWEFIIMLLTLVNLIYVPLEVCFDFGADQSFIGWLLMEMLPSQIFMIDIFVSFFKAYYDKGILISRKKDIFYHYIAGEFIIDLMVVLPFFFQQFGLIQTNYFMLIRITKVRVMLQTIKNIMNFREKPQAIFELVCMVYYLIMMSHFLGCIFNKLAQIEKEYYNYPITWLDAQGIYEEQWTTRYIFGFYYAAITIMTIGYGDISPVTNPERIFIAFLSFFVTGVIGYVINNIGSIISKFDPSNSSYYQQITIINNHMKRRGLSLQLQFKVRTYFEHYLQLKKEEDVDLKDLIGQMNTYLREEVQVNMYKNYFKKSDFLSQNFSDSFLSSLCSKIFEKNYSPGENILTKYDQNSNLIFVLHGEVESYVPKSQIQGKDTHIQYNYEGFIIGERQFFFNEASNFFIKAANFVHTAQITKEDFTCLIKRFPEDHEKFCYKRERFIHREEQFVNNTPCQVCQTSHKFNSCPYTFVFLNKNRYINNFTNNTIQKRHKFLRNKRQTKYPQSVIRKNGLQIIISQLLQSNLESIQSLFKSNVILERLGLSQKDIQIFKKSELINEIEQYIDNSEINSLSTQKSEKIALSIPTLLQTKQQESHKNHLISLFNQKNIEPAIYATEINASHDIDKIYMGPNKYFYPNYNIHEITKNYNLFNYQRKKTSSLIKFKKRITIQTPFEQIEQEQTNSKSTTIQKCFQINQMESKL